MSAASRRFSPSGVPAGAPEPGIRPRNDPSDRIAMTAQALSCQVTICNERGLHARASASFVRCASAFDARVSVGRDGTMVSGTSIMGLLALGAGPGTRLDILAEGREAQAALDALAELVSQGFGED